MKRNRMKQCGRSMVEMLAVLAVIGVLSVAALYGFHHALIKMRGNRVIEDVQLAGFVVRDELFDQLAVAESRSLNTLFRAETAYSFWAGKESEQSFFVVAEDLSEDLCKELLLRKVQWLEEIHANEIGGTCASTHNDLYFYFNADMNGETALNSKECRVDSDCDASQPHCINGWCRPCVEGEFLIKASNQFQCTACPGVGGRKASFSGSACYTCGDNYYTTEDGVWCAECTNTFLTGGITREECARCPNRCYDEEADRCYATEVDNAFNNNGICNYDCPAGQMFAQEADGGQKRCAACPGIGRHVRYFSTVEQCHRCGDNYYAAEGGGRCGECTNTFLSAGVTREECARCPNRCYDEETGRCYDAEVGNVFNNNGICNYDCPAGQMFAQEADGGQKRCAACPGIGRHVRYFSTVEQCHRCGDNYYAAEGGGRCGECTNTFLSAGVTREECARCPNRCYDEETKRCPICS